MFLASGGFKSAEVFIPGRFDQIGVFFNQFQFFFKKRCHLIEPILPVSLQEIYLSFSESQNLIKDCLATPVRFASMSSWRTIVSLFEAGFGHKH